ncbi:pilus assembly protein TadG-related protein [Herbaspirillum sp. SJZ107]|uniref:pilus assembly protein TadG-related protein n=1 Tax=Herbaspirillum sp. SJZ107 TaxID=2572881 RepID=UPI0011503BE8|nr:pilus assembly protein TadG-related protein [Herbaspirillum sp. SJZ107]TQK11322.1 putative Flp pilus-assembly TadE/G-like protein [Herbaspirillum sp. SJZ107]
MKDKVTTLNRDSSFLKSWSSSRAGYGIKQETGAIAIMTVLLLPVILGFFMLALDLSRIYNRQAEMQILADAVALAAAKKLDGTSAGVNAALTAAQQVVEDQVNGPKYAYLHNMTWENAAITFGASHEAGSGWKSSGDAAASPAGLVFVKVDTKLLSGKYGKVALFFAPIISASFSSVEVGHVTIAGKGRLQVTPLAICAMSSTPRDKRPNSNGAQYDELIEYGFRRGVGYDLMNLNPKGPGPMSFQVDPVSLAGSGAAASNLDPSIYAAYICTGTMAVRQVTGATVAVQSPFPIGTYFGHLNSRFDPYSGTCDVNNSPPDSNVKQYAFAGVSWMSTKATVQVAKQDFATTTKLQTVAEIGPTNYPTAVDYGVLWSFARAVPWSSVTNPNAPEPPGGYTPFAATSPNIWSKLYGSTSTIGTYPASAPYLMASGGAYFQSPAVARRPGTANRRVLNIPLLSCPVTGSTATVLGTGKFLMTTQASATSLYAEFGGLTTEDQLGGPVEIYQ